jgi:hypothetical protein
MSVKRPRGRRRLKWWLVIFGVAVAFLSMRHEHNLFADAWSRVTGAEAGQNKPVVDAIKPEAAPVRKCEVEDGTLYSNVECDPRRPDSEHVESHESSDLESPESPSPPPADVPETPPDKSM